MYKNLAEAIEDAREKGYTHLFEVEDQCLACRELDRKFDAEELEITATYHFDRGTDAGDEASLYLIESKTGVRGYLVSSYTTHRNREKAEFLDTLLAKK